MGEQCPLCKQGRGDLRHVIVWCAHEPLPVIRSTPWDAVEGRMQSAASVEWWRSPERAGAVRHPAGWEGLGTVEEEEERWPVLTYTGWLRPTEGEAILAAGLMAGQGVERGHDLGYRGVVPAGLAKAWREVDKGGPQAAVGTIALAALAMRERYAADAKAYVAQVGQPGADDGQRAEEADSSADEEWPRPEVGRPCRGRWCAEQEEERLEELLEKAELTLTHPPTGVQGGKKKLLAV